MQESQVCLHEFVSEIASALVMKRSFIIFGDAMSLEIVVEPCKSSLEPLRPFLKILKISSIENNIDCHMTLDSIMSIDRQDVVHALLGSNRICRNLYSSLCILKLVFCCQDHQSRSANIKICPLRLKICAFRLTSQDIRPFEVSDLCS